VYPSLPHQGQIYYLARESRPFVYIYMLDMFTVSLLRG